MTPFESDAWLSQCEARRNRELRRYVHRCIKSILAGRVFGALFSWALIEWMNKS